MPEYIDALEREIYLLTTNHYPLTTVFIGGGTPSILSPQQLRRLLNIIKNNFDLTNLKEMTFEANPESLDREKLSILQELFSEAIRLSIGLQCFDNKYLKDLGRIHSSEEFLDKYTQARMLGINNINIDLIYGLPGQGLAQWQNTLQKTVALKPEHISAYCLTPAKGTMFDYNNVSVDENIASDMYKFTSEYLPANGYGHYEISNFALSGRECVHNKIYWGNKEYIGIGASAVSYINGVRSKNVADLGAYLKDAGKKSLVEESESLDEESKLGETVMLGLRMRRGIELTQQIESKYTDIITKYKNDGFLEIADNRMFLTQKALFVSNTILADFV